MKKLGLRGESLQRIKLGRGAVGKTSSTTLALMTVLAIVALRLGSDWMLLTLAGLAICVFAFYLIMVLRFAAKNPGPALLEGAELLVWQSTEVAAKGLPRPPVSLPQPDPSRIAGGSEDTVADTGEDEPEQAEDK